MKILTKFDYILILFFIILAIGFNFILSIFLKEEVTDGKVFIYYKNNVVKQLPLDKDIVFPINSDIGNNTIEIKNNKVKMIEADCKDKICLYERGIEYNNETIICLPNKILIKIQSSNESEIDSYVR